MEGDLVQNDLSWEGDLVQNELPDEGPAWLVMYPVQVARRDLENLNISHTDSWAANFCQDREGTMVTGLPVLSPLFYVSLGFWYQETSWVL